MSKSAVPPRRSAFTLVEVTLALGVAAFSLVAIFGLLPIGLSTNQTAAEQTAANGILSAILSDLRATLPTSPRGQTATSQQFSIVIPANPLTNAPATKAIYITADGKPASTLQSDSHFLATVVFVPNGSNTRAPTYVKLTVSWPAVAAAHPNGSLVIFAALDRN